MANNITFKPQITIPGSSFKEGASSTVTASTAFIGEYIKAIYNYLLAIVGLLAAIVLMVSGIVWLTAAGNTERISQAKNWMMGSFTGLILALSSFLLLKLINPNLVNFQIQEIETITAQENGCCVSTKSQDKAFETTSKDCYSTLVNSGEITAISDKDLESKYENNLSKYLSGKFFTGYIVDGDKCVQLTEEEKAINKEECFGKGLSDSWGEKCNTTNTYTYCYCFSEKAYGGGNGAIGEPCGNEFNSRCVQKDRCVNRDLGGRSCYESTCCKSSAIITIDNSQCKDKNNGDYCNNDNEDCYCYDKIAYQGKGIENEPCGLLGGKCHTGGAVNKCQTETTGLKWDSGEGRNCSGLALWCCY